MDALTDVWLAYAPRETLDGVLEELGETILELDVEVALSYGVYVHHVHSGVVLEAAKKTRVVAAWIQFIK